MTNYILAIDDETDIIDLYKVNFRREIKQEKYRFFFATDGEEALNLLAAHQEISVVLADINMPGMDGLTFLGRIAQHGYIDQEYQFVKVIMVTAYGDMPNIRRAFNFGAFDFLMKPWNFQDMEITINKALRETSKLREFHHRLKEEQERRLQAERTLAEIGGVLSSNLGIGGGTGNFTSLNV